MKRRILQLIEAAAMLTVAWMSGCGTSDSQATTPQNTSTALLVVSEETALAPIDTTTLMQSPVQTDR